MYNLGCDACYIFILYFVGKIDLKNIYAFAYVMLRSKLVCVGFQPWMFAFVVSFMSF